MKKILLLNIFALMLFSIQMTAQCTIQVFTSDVTEETCVGSSDASATAFGGGVAPISYLWSNGQTSETATSLTTGTYTVTATDGAGCTGSATAEVLLNAEGVWLMFSFTPVTCNGGSDGTAHVSVMTGVAPYTYIWNDPAGTTSADPVNLTAGQYTVTVTDSNGCSNYGPVTVTEPTVIVVVSNTTNETCFGDADGTASVSVSGGTPGYTYIWSDGQTTATANNLTAGDYTFTVTDANGCPSTATLTVDLTNPQIVISGTPAPVSCFGGNDGSATVTVNSGNGLFSYSWSNGGTSATISNLVAGDYTATVTGADGCTSITTVSVPEPPELNLTITNTTNVSCNGGGDGSITVSSTGGTGSITYSWSNGSTTGTISNLSIGTYTVTATDGNGCIATASATITEPSELTSTGSGTDVTVNGGNDGTATVTASGGTPGYTYLWSDGQATATATNLTAGTYTVTVTDSNGCTTTTIVVIEEPPCTAITIATSHSNETCVGSMDGHVAVNTSGGVGQMTFLWSNGATTSVVNNLSVGTYTVTVTDQNGCTASGTETIELSPEGIWVDITITNACFNGSNGTANAIVTTGVPSYTYAWSNGGTTANITGLSAGDYTVSVTDSNGCIGIFSTTIGEENQIIATTSHSNETCVGSMDGHVAVSTNGGAGQMTFLWSNGATTSVVSNLSVGTYTVTVTDENGCTATGTETIELSPEGIWVDITTTNVTCFNGSDGSANAIVTTGVPSYTYAWSNGASTANITNLTAGDYTVSVTDSNGCIGIFTTTITQPSELIATTTSTNITCVVTTGTANVSATGGTPGYTYLWSNGQTTQNINGLSAGTYTATVTDANLCTAVSSTTIIDSSVVIITTISATDPSGPGASDGSIDIEPSGGSNYTYEWSNGATTQDISGLVAGCYTVTVTDGNGICQGVKTICIPTCELILNVTTTNNDCDNDNIGTATATVSQNPVNCTDANYTYTWTTDTNDPIGGNTQTITGLVNGTYLVTVTNDAGLIITGSGVVTGGSDLSSSATWTNILCNGDINGTATGNGINGNPDYGYEWSNGLTTQTITNLSAGTYTITVTDLTMCTSVSTVTIIEPPVISISISSTDPNPLDASNGEIDITVSGGTPGYTYLWSNGATTEDLIGIDTGCYTVTVTDMNMCMAMDSVCIPTPPECMLTVISTPETCNPGNNGTVTATMVGSTCTLIQPINFAWEDINGVNVGNTAIVTGLSEGTYFVTATDVNMNIQTASVDVDFTSGVIGSVLSTNISCNGESDGTATVSGSGGVTFPNGDYMYSWSNDSTTASISNLAPDTYTVTITDATNCSDTLTVIITEDDPIEVTEIITPLNCFGDTIAAISISASGGVPFSNGSYNYLWSNGDTIDGISNLIAGTYTVTVTDSVGCEKIEDYLIDEPQEVTISAIDTLSTCDTIATLNATASGGATITWYDGLPFGAATEVGTLPSYTYSNIPSGETTLYVVADSSGCQAIDSIKVIQNAVDVSVTPNVSVCLGEITQLMATNNIPGHTFGYLWSPADKFVAGTETSATPTLVTSAIGAFEVYLTSTNQYDCVQMDTINVMVQDTTPIIINSTQCVALEVTYSTNSGVDMIWDFGDMSPQVTAISTIHIYDVPGEYIVTATFVDPQVCLPNMISDTITVYDDNIFDSSITLAYDSCAANSTEVIYSGMSTNVFNSPVASWEWCLLSDPTTIISTNQDDTILISTTITDILQLKIEAENGCVDTVFMPIEVNIITDTLQNITACIGTDADLNPNPNPDYTYEWFPDGPIITIIDETQSGTYSVTITDNLSSFPCAIEGEVELFVPEAISVDLEGSPDTILCEAGDVTLTASSNVSPIKFSWYGDVPPNDILNPDSPTLGLTILEEHVPSYYYVEARDTFGCASLDSVLVGNAGIIVLLDGFVNCLGTEEVIIPSIITNIDPTYYLWNNPNGETIGTDPTLTITPTISGDYTFTVGNEYCEEVFIFNVEVVDISNDPQAVADPIEIILGETVELDVEYENGPYTFSWSDARNTIVGDPTLQTTEAVPNVEGEHYYNVVVTDEASSCTTLSTVLVVTTGCDRSYVFFPNAFSPNGDGRNDVLKVESVVVDEVYFVIYNRWGEKVFEGDSVDSAWDGTHNGEPVCTDVYGYYMRAVCVNGTVIEEKGNVTVLK